MKHLEAEHLTLLNTLLNKTEKLVEYFSHAETRMNIWRHEIIQQATCQQTQLTSLNAELNRIETLLSEINFDPFRIAAECETSQENEYLDSLKHTEQQLLRQIHDHRAELTRITQHAMTQISHTITQAASAIDERVSEHFPSSAPDLMHAPTQSSTEDLAPSIDEPMKQKAIPFTSPKYRKWRSVTLTLVTTLITAIIFGMYANNEYPWEMHQQATSERNAGRILLHAWPSLTHEEKSKILYKTP